LGDEKRGSSDAGERGGSTFSKRKLWTSTGVRKVSKLTRLQAMKKRDLG